MKFRVLTVACFVTLGWQLATPPASAQVEGNESSSVIGGTGSVSVVCIPKYYRMSIELEGKAKTLEIALAQLKTRREKAAKQLEAMGADAKSISVSSPMQTADASEQRKTLEASLMEKFKRAGRDPKSITLPTNSVVAASLTASWPLKPGTAEELLIQMQQIKTKVEAAKLAGSEEKQQLSPEEQELAEEMASNGRSGSSFSNESERAGPGQPNFVVVSTIQPVDREKALAQAFFKAKADASGLAKAAGATLGELKALQAYTGAAPNSYEQAMMAQRYRNRGYSNEGQEDTGEDGAIVSPPMAEVKVLVRVMAQFRLKPPSN